MERPERLRAAVGLPAERRPGARRRAAFKPKRNLTALRPPFYRFQIFRFRRRFQELPDVAFRDVALRGGREPGHSALYLPVSRFRWQGDEGGDEVSRPALFQVFEDAERKLGLRPARWPVLPGTRAEGSRISGRIRRSRPPARAGPPFPRGTQNTRPGSACRSRP
jgi:hypothetical protein